MTSLLPIVLAAVAAAGSNTSLECRAAGFAAAPAFYAIDLISTKNVPGSGLAGGVAEIVFSPSPFGVSLTENGDYLQDIAVKVHNLRAPRQGKYVVWVTTPSLDRSARIGVLGEDVLRGQVRWNKFLVVISLEEDEATRAERWAGPIALRGMSRSGAMHTSAGHGPFVVENCVGYGFNG